MDHYFSIVPSYNFWLAALACAFFTFSSSCSTDFSDTEHSNHHRAVCGNGVQEPGELCDGNDIGALSCGSFGFTTGTLTCGQDCLSVDTKQCMTKHANDTNSPDPGNKKCDDTTFFGQIVEDESKQDIFNQPPFNYRIGGYPTTANIPASLTESGQQKISYVNELLNGSSCSWKPSYNSGVQFLSRCYTDSFEVTGVVTSTGLNPYEFYISDSTGSAYIKLSDHRDPENQGIFPRTGDLVKLRVSELFKDNTNQGISRATIRMTESNLHVPYRKITDAKDLVPYAIVKITGTVSNRLAERDENAVCQRIYIQKGIFQGSCITQ